MSSIFGSLFNQSPTKGLTLNFLLEKRALENLDIIFEGFLVELLVGILDEIQVNLRSSYQGADKIVVFRSKALIKMCLVLSDQ